MEIERKYLVRRLPDDLSKYEAKKIAQGYLCTDPVVRIRRSNDNYYMTYKGDGLMVREEYNLPLTREAYEHLLPKIDGLLIAKTRYLIPLTDRLTAELYVYEGVLSDTCGSGVRFRGGGKRICPTGMVWRRCDRIRQISQQLSQPAWTGLKRRFPSWKPPFCYYYSIALYPTSTDWQTHTAASCGSHISDHRSACTNLPPE